MRLRFYKYSRRSSGVSRLACGPFLCASHAHLNCTVWDSTDLAPRTCAESPICAQLARRDTIAFGAALSEVA